MLGKVAAVMTGGLEDLPGLQLLLLQLHQPSRGQLAGTMTWGERKGFGGKSYFVFYK